MEKNIAIQNKTWISHHTLHCSNRNICSLGGHRNSFVLFAASAGGMSVCLMSMYLTSFVKGRFYMNTLVIAIEFYLSGKWPHMRPSFWSVDRSPNCRTSPTSDTDPVATRRRIPRRMQRAIPLAREAKWNPLGLFAISNLQWSTYLSSDVNFFFALEISSTFTIVRIT